MKRRLRPENAVFEYLFHTLLTSLRTIFKNKKTVFSTWKTSILSWNFLELDDVLGPWEYHGCHEVDEMIANDGIESSVGGM